jgi:exodeoxyribonuclease VII large subunit
VGSVKGTLALLGPGPTLKRGFSVTRKEGHAVSDARDLAEGDVIVTEFAQGSVSSVVKTITPPKD